MCPLWEQKSCSHVGGLPWCIFSFCSCMAILFYELLAHGTSFMPICQTTYVKPQLSATTLNIFSVISCPAPFTSSLPSLCLCDYLWTFSKHLFAARVPESAASLPSPQLQIDPHFPKALVLSCFLLQAAYPVRYNRDPEVPSASGFTDTYSLDPAAKTLGWWSQTTW